MLPASFRLYKRSDFKHLFANGRVIYNQYFNIRYIKNNEKNSRFAILVSKKVSKKAVKRNRLKRVIREIIRLNLDNIYQGFDYCIILKPKILEIKSLVLKEELLKFLVNKNENSKPNIS